MKTSVEDILEGMEEKYGNLEELGTEGTIRVALEELVEQELPHLQEELERFDSRKFSTIGRVEFLEEIREEIT